MNSRPPRLLLPAMLALFSTDPARAQSPGELEFVIPEGFVEVVRDGVPSPDAHASPQLAALSQNRGLHLMAGKLGPSGSVEGTFQVTLINRPSTFDASFVDRFASELAAEWNGAGLKVEVAHKDGVEIAGRPSGRVVLHSPGRRMLFYGVPDGQRTALLLYAASDRDFPSLFHAFEKSALATHVKGGAQPVAAPAVAAPAPADAPPAPADAPPAPSSSLAKWMALGALGVLFALIATLMLRRAPASAPPPAKPRKRR